MSEIAELNNTQERLNSIGRSLNAGAFVRVRKLLLDLPASDVALLLESSPTKTRDELWQLLDADFHGDVLEELSEDVRNGIITKMVPATVVDALEEMDTDDLAETLSSLPDDVLQSILKSMDAQDRARAEKALSYGEETAGFIMNTDTITLRPDVSVDVVLRYLRLKTELPENTDTLYVVSRQDVLIGTVSLAALLVASPDTSVSDIMDDEPELISADTPDEEVASVIARYN